MDDGWMDEWTSTPTTVRSPTPTTVWTTQKTTWTLGNPANIFNIGHIGH